MHERTQLTTSHTLAPPNIFIAIVVPADVTCLLLNSTHVQCMDGTAVALGRGLTVLVRYQKLRGMIA
jgi:hypothetical protein